MEYAYNIYDLNWKFLGWIWAGNPLFPYKLEGDYIKTVWDNGMLTRDGVEIEKNKPMEVYLKLMEVKEIKK